MSTLKKQLHKNQSCLLITIRERGTINGYRDIETYIYQMVTQNQPSLLIDKRDKIDIQKYIHQKVVTQKLIPFINSYYRLQNYRLQLQIIDIDINIYNDVFFIKNNGEKFRSIEVDWISNLNPYFKK